ncbi:hypothetical protein BDV96DRAFT_654768 [Lophiotrema nucula]|uniref:MARVEL domain-containing protein n=1 Tax=Lophiotrema nucula TaxID=690887 RepID=A0A6A5YJK2_9PLEO|nr:hypothetical protein BDV96DRAFT_654768 [Lophiotrema nucula]
MTSLFILLHALSAFIAALCIVILGLVSHSAILSDRVVPSSVHNIRGTGLGLLFWPGVGGIVDFALFLILLVLPAKHQSPTRVINLRFPNSTLFVGIVIFLRPLIVLIYEFIEHESFLTVENWACAAKQDALCDELRAAQYILIPILILSASLLAITIWVWVRVSKEGRSTRDSSNAERVDANTSTAAV